MNEFSPDRVAELLPLCDSLTFNADVFLATGVFVCRNLFPVAIVDAWRSAWAEFQANKLAIRRVGFNRVQVEEPLPPGLQTLYDNPGHISVARQIFGDDVGLYNHRLIIKDKFSRDPVFLHQDYCYHLGFPNKASFFAPLSFCGRENGGLEFFPGTHQYGYLGDAGEIDPTAFPAWPSLLPELFPGDLVVMNSCLWHRSGPHLGGGDRIVADTILQPARDPSTIARVCGTVGPVNRIDRRDSSVLFRRSRTSRLRELTAELGQAKGKGR